MHYHYQPQQSSRLNLSIKSSREAGLYLQHVIVMRINKLAAPKVPGVAVNHSQDESSDTYTKPVFCINRKVQLFGRRSSTMPTYIATNILPLLFLAYIYNNKLIIFIAQLYTS